MGLQDVFKKYDIRGGFQTDFNSEDVRKIARGIVLFSKSKGIDTAVGVVVAHDSRIFSREVFAVLVSEISKFEMRVVSLGLSPTPTLSFFLHQNRQYRLGLVITASHNPWGDTGLKLTLDCEPLWGEGLQELFDFVSSGNLCEDDFLVEAEVADFSQQARAAYLDFLQKEFFVLAGWQPKVVVDCMHGAALSFVPDLVKKFGWKNFEVLRTSLPLTSDRVDGPDSSQEKYLRPLFEAMKKNDADFGVAFDGDADRVSLVTKEGVLLKGDELLTIFASRMPAGSRVVTEVKSSHALEAVAHTKGFSVVRSATGHPLIRDAMKKSFAVLGGEFSGHIFFADRYFGFDDATYAFLRLCEILQEGGVSLTSLLEQLPQFYSSSQNLFFDASFDRVALVKKVLSHFEGKGLVLSKIDGVKVFFNQNSWALIRASNTTACLTLRFESDVESDVGVIESEVLSCIKKHRSAT